MEASQTSAPCCQPLTSAALSESDAAQLAAAFKALADPARLRLFSMVASVPNGDACACDFVEAGLLSREQRGRWAYFRVVPDRLAQLCDILAPSD